MSSYGGSILKTETEEWFAMLEVGRPGAALTNVDKTEQLLKGDRRLSLRDSLNASLERVHQIVTVKLGMNRNCAKWVPRDNCEKKRKEIVWKSANEMLNLMNKNSSFRRK
jgi:hypothetical protein